MSIIQSRYAHILCFTSSTQLSQLTVETSNPTILYIKTSQNEQPIKIEIDHIYEVIDTNIYSITVGTQSEEKALFTYTKKSD